MGYITFAFNYSHSYFTDYQLLESHYPTSTGSAVLCMLNAIKLSRGENLYYFEGCSTVVSGALILKCTDFQISGSHKFTDISFL
jgi:hypothetical protein